MSRPGINVRSILCSTPHSKQPSKWVSCVLSTPRQSFHSLRSLASFQQPSLPRVRHFLARALTTWATAVDRGDRDCPQNPSAQAYSEKTSQRKGFVNKAGNGKWLTLDGGSVKLFLEPGTSCEKAKTEEKDEQGDNCGCVCWGGGTLWVNLMKTQEWHSCDAGQDWINE